MDKHCVSDTYTLMEVIESFQRNHDRVACVLNSEDKMIGIVSQGDIIRALCDGKSIYANIRKIIRSDFLYLKSRDMESAYKIFKNKGITMLPIVNDDFYVLDVVTQEDIYNYLEKRGLIE